MMVSVLRMTFLKGKSQKLVWSQRLARKVSTGYKKRGFDYETVPPLLYRSGHPLNLCLPHKSHNSSRSLFPCSYYWQLRWRFV